MRNLHARKRGVGDIISYEWQSPWGGGGGGGGGTLKTRGGHYILGYIVRGDNIS